ncbi:MAG: high-affinity nickel-transporter protein [Halarchaeum sp.]
MLTSALVVGGAFGVRHAFEADHLAAVATLAEEDGAAATGMAWGVGHSVPVLGLGGAFVALDVSVPPAVSAVFEGVVALVLIALGARVLLGRESLGAAVVRHVHGRTEHRHVTVQGRGIGLTHTHAAEESFAVGVVHGLAGSGGVVVLLAAAAPADGTGFLVGFALATVAAMGVAASGWGVLDACVPHLRAFAGVASVAVGVLLLAETLGVA